LVEVRKRWLNISSAKKPWKIGWKPCYKPVVRVLSSQTVQIWGIQ